jgi:hypothetical protein
MIAADQVANILFKGLMFSMTCPRCALKFRVRNSDPKRMRHITKFFRVIVEPVPDEQAP